MIDNEEDAKEYLELLIQYNMSYSDDNNAPLTRELATKNAKDNIGYWAGYCSSEVGARMHRLFCCAHPVFGNFNNGTPTPEEAFKASQEFGEKIKKQKEG